MLGALSAKKPPSWWEKHENLKLNLLAQQTQLYSDTEVDCMLDIKVLKKKKQQQKKRDIWNTENTEGAKEMFPCLPKSHKGV